MGMHPSADLYYGYDLGEMVDDDWESTAPAWWQEAEENEDEADWEDELAKRLGWVYAPFPDDYPAEDRTLWRMPYGPERKQAEEAQRRVKDEYEKNSPAYQAWSKSLKEKQALLAEIPVELCTYGHCDGDTYWAVRVKASVQHVYGCDSSPVDSLEVDPGWVGQLARFVELLELNVPADGPGWHLNVSYG